MMLLPCLHRYAHSCRSISFHGYLVQSSISQQTQTCYHCSCYCHDQKWFVCFSKCPCVSFHRKDGKGINILRHPPAPPPFPLPTPARAFPTLSLNFQQPRWRKDTRPKALRCCLLVSFQETRMFLCACPQGQENPSAISSLLCWPKASPWSSLPSLHWFRWGAGPESLGEGCLNRWKFHFCFLWSFAAYILWFAYPPLYWVSKLPICGLLH